MTQFIVVVEGEAIVIQHPNRLYQPGSGSLIIIPAGIRHYVAIRIFFFFFFFFFIIRDNSRCTQYMHMKV